MNCTKPAGTPKGSPFFPNRYATKTAGYTTAAHFLQRSTNVNDRLSGKPHNEAKAQPTLLGGTGATKGRGVLPTQIGQNQRASATAKTRARSRFARKSDERAASSSTNYVCPGRVSPASAYGVGSEPLCPTLLRSGI